MTKDHPQVAILMGSKSDWQKMASAGDVLNEFGISFEMKILSAHRMPDRVVEYAKSAAARGIELIIGGAGMAAHLAGALAANCVLPVIGVPLSGGTLNGIDALYATVQMPKGIPVATVAIDGAANAGFLAIQILSIKEPALREKLESYRAAERKKLDEA